MKAAAASTLIGTSPPRVSSSATAAEWDGYVATHPDASGYHQWCWRGLFERVFGHETIYLVARAGELGADARADQDAIVGVLPLVHVRSVVFGKSLVSLPFVNYGGILADDEVAARLLVDAARAEAERRGALCVEFRHTRRMFAELPVKQHKVAMLLALPGDVEAAWKGFDNKVRNQVRKAERSQFEILTGGAELVDDFYAVFARNMRDLGTPVYSRRLFEEVAGNIPESQVFSIRLGGRPVAGGLTIGYRRSVENPWASSLREHRALNPNMLLYWSMLQDAIRRGYGQFDFGRSTPHEGTYQFKKQWGAQDSPFFWEYVLKSGAALPDHSPKNSRFSLAVSVWQRLPLWIANTAGPRIVRNIP
jgi:serine/alanine adding enzyme